MDRPLSSDRSARDGHYGPAGGGFGGGGGPRYSRGRGGGRGRGNYSSNFRGPPRRDFGRGRGGGGPRRSGNRFQPAEHYQQSSSVLTNLLKALNQVGHVKPTPVPVVAATEAETQQPQQGEERAVVKQQATNIQGLTTVVCGTPDVFLKYNNNHTSHNNAQLAFGETRPTADAVAGPLAVGVVHAVTAWPLQTPCYAALTLSIQETSASNPSVAGFGARTVAYAVRVLARDVDSLLLQKVMSSSSSGSSTELQDAPRALARVRLVLRYLAQLASLGLVSALPERDQAVPAATTQRPVSFLGLVQVLVQAAVQAASERHDQNQAAARVLAMLVYSTIPHVLLLLQQQEKHGMGGAEEDETFVQEVLVQPLEELLQAYQSDFVPGIGARAILLQAEQLEDMQGDDNPEDEEEEDDDDDDDEQASGQVCDSWQDLVRAVHTIVKEPTAPRRLALFSDQPWKALASPAPSSLPLQEGPDAAMPQDPAAAPARLAYHGEALSLEIFPTCQSLTLLLGGEVPSQVKLARVDMGGMIYGRLPIFGAPTGVDDEEDEDDDDGMEAQAKNERLDSYKTTFGLVDRYFLSETVRDCLLSLESSVSDTGVDRGDLKAVAEQVWSLCSMIQFPEEDTKGLEFCILETILSLVVQASTASPYRLVYLSRVLLELTRLEPAIMSGAIALAVSNLFQDYMPALVPTARYNLSRWLAFHLINTDYQWPAAFWKHWEPFVSYGWKNSRGAFVKHALAIMVENLSNPELLVTQCLPKESSCSSLADQLLPTRPEAQLGDDNPLASMAQEMEMRIWDSREDPAMLCAYLTGDEVSETAMGALDIDAKSRLWWRTGILMHALLAPVRREYDQMLAAIAKAKIVAAAATTTEQAMEEAEEEVVIHDDSLPNVVDAMVQYKTAILGVLAKDAESRQADFDLSGEVGGDVNDLIPGQVFLLHQLTASTFYSTAVHIGCLQALLEQQIVSVQSIFSWALGDNTQGGSVQLQWWEFVLAGIRFDVQGIVAQGEEAANMVLDGVKGEEEEAFPEAQKILDYLDPLLSYGARRVDQVLQELHQSGAETKGRKLTPAQVELVEGFKVLVVECHALFCSATNEMCGQVSISLTTKLQEALAESAIAGPKLAVLVGADGTNQAVSVLKQSLERMH